MIEAKILRSRGKDMVCLAEYKSPQLKGKKVILYKHGFCGNKITPHRMMVNLGHDLVEEGYTIVRFDCVGAGDSEGDWTYMTLSGEIEDYKRVLHWTKEEFSPEKMMILAYSMGALETVSCWQEAPLDGMLFWSPCAKAYECFCHLLGSERFDRGMSGQDVDYMGDRVGKEFFLDLEKEEFNNLEALQGFQKPLYIIHGLSDRDVFPENAKKYMEILPQAKLHLVEGAGHGYDSWKTQEELWKYSKKYIRRIME